MRLIQWTITTNDDDDDDDDDAHANQLNQQQNHIKSGPSTNHLNSSQATKFDEKQPRAKMAD